MALAMIYPEATPGKRSEARRVLESKRLSDALLSNARTVLKHSAALAQDVMADRVALDVASPHALQCWSANAMPPNHANLLAHLLIIGVIAVDALVLTLAVVALARAI